MFRSLRIAALPVLVLGDGLKLLFMDPRRKEPEGRDGLQNGGGGARGGEPLESGVNRFGDSRQASPCTLLGLTARAIVCRPLDLDIMENRGLKFGLGARSRHVIVVPPHFLLPALACCLLAIYANRKPVAIPSLFGWGRGNLLVLSRE